MVHRNKQEIGLSLVPSIEITEAKTSLSSSRRTSQVDGSAIAQGKSSLPSRSAPKLYPYTPLDSLMFPLFSALQHKAWGRAKRLCYELMLCDPERRSYQDLYRRLEQITDLIGRQLHPRSVLSRATTASNNREKLKEEQMEEN